VVQHFLAAAVGQHQLASLSVFDAVDVSLGENQGPQPEPWSEGQLELRRMALRQVRQAMNDMPEEYNED
jgi:hypothetical protein